MSTDDQEPVPTTDECCECGKEFVIEDGCDCRVVHGYDVDDANKDAYIDKCGIFFVIGVVTVALM